MLDEVAGRVCLPPPPSLPSHRQMKLYCTYRGLREPPAMVASMRKMKMEGCVFTQTKPPLVWRFCSTAVFIYYLFKVISFLMMWTFDSWWVYNWFGCNTCTCFLSEVLSENENWINTFHDTHCEALCFLPWKPGLCLQWLCSDWGQEKCRRKGKCHFCHSRCEVIRVTRWWLDDSFFLLLTGSEDVRRVCLTCRSTRIPFYPVG